MIYETSFEMAGWNFGEELAVLVDVTVMVEDASFDHAFGTQKAVDVYIEDEHWTYYNLEGDIVYPDRDDVQFDKGEYNLGISNAESDALDYYENGG
jgi:hypothetical protein